MSRQSKKPSTVRHTRAVQRDRTKRLPTAPPDEHIERRLHEVIHPATYAQLAHFHALGLRQRTLTLPVMVAFVTSLIWRQIGSVSEALRVLKREGLLWTAPTRVSQQALSERLRTLPARLFESILNEILPQMHERWQERSRPRPPVIERALGHFAAVLALDGSTLDALLRKVGLLRDKQKTPLAGRMAALLDVASMLPREVFFEPKSRAHDQRFWPRVLERLEPGVLLIFDLGLVKHTIFDELTDQGVSFITRLRKDAVFEIVYTIAQGARWREHVVVLGSAVARCEHRMRLVEVLYQGQWYRYVSNVLDPKILSAKDVATLYRCRWRIEEAFNTVKRLLGLAYFLGGSRNAVELQVWMTWVLYAVLIDLSDAVAEALQEPFSRISVEMVYRGLYHFTQAYHRGEADDVVSYLAAEAKDLGILKRRRRRGRKKPETDDLTSSSPP